MNDERISNLEMKISFQEKTLEDLSHVFYGQQKRIDHLERLCSELAERVRNMTEILEGHSGLKDPAGEKPPHY
jgi:SlyX protein